MIAIPKTLKVKRNRASEAMLIEKARAWVEGSERTPGLHASDLLDPRMAYWQRKEPQSIPDRLVNTFLIGKVLHAFVINAVHDKKDGGITETDEGSRYSTDLGISWSPDLDLDGIIRELKTSRSFYEPKTRKDLELYIEQLLIYMAAKGTSVAEIWVLYLNLREKGKGNPSFRCYTVSLPAVDLEEVTKALKQTAEALDLAIGKDEPENLPLCRKFKCGKGNCQWWESCKPEGRYGLTPKKWEA